MNDVHGWEASISGSKKGVFMVRNGGDGLEMCPPLSPIGERNVETDREFVKNCQSVFDKLNKMGRVVFVSQSLTENIDFGIVFRADFKLENELPGPLVDRLVCWKKEGGRIGSIIAIGQDIPPLSVTK